MKQPNADLELQVFQRLITDRWSCRAFLPAPLPHDQIVSLLELAQRAPSWCNTQPWEVHITEGPATDRFRRELLAHATDPESSMQPDIPMPSEYTGVHLQRRRESGWQLYGAVGIGRGDRESAARQALQNFELFGAPHVAVITVDSSQGAYGVLDTGVYVANFLLAAASLGLGAIPQAALATCSPFVRDFFDIAHGRSVVLGVSLGLPDADHPANGYRTNRASLDEVVKWCTS